MPKMNIEYLQVAILTLQLRLLKNNFVYESLNIEIVLK